MTKVLIVDDDIDLLKTLAATVEHLGFEAVVADSAEAGVDTFQKDEFAILFADYRLPHRNGVELSEAIRQVDQKVPIVIFTNYANDQIVRAAMRQRCADFIEKPIDLKMFSALVEKYCTSFVNKPSA